MEVMVTCSGGGYEWSCGCRREKESRRMDRRLAICRCGDVEGMRE